MYASTLFLTVVSGLAATVAANYTEYVSNYTFTHWGPTWDASKFDYELSMAKEAIDLFKDRLGDKGNNLTVPETTADLPAALAQLHTTKANLGPDGLLALFKQDIADADEYWHDAIADSDGTTWKPTDGHCICYIPSLSAASFGLWSTSPAADAANNDVNPEHYIKQTSTGSNGLPTSNILEGWGGVTTHFDIMNFTAPDHTKYPFLRTLPDYPVQAAGPKVLKDGTTFGVLHLAVKDVNDAKYGKGFEVFSTIWYQSGVTEEHIEAEREHMINEIINLSIIASKDVKSNVAARSFSS
ncbi:hypothetical protein PG999_012221 [Apiospora kogelbergensis]|uniref:Uncharacterized protein n=1 Tax=Apiospora kogelbergensis TaxID=1337665 RepID=A0AAW0QMG2_9PEZI